MIKLNRTTEYGLMALRHMSRKGLSGTHACGSSVTSAREVAESYGLPFEITAKTLQRLKDTGLIQSAQGARGGYTLRRSLDEINLAEFLQLMEGPQSVVACASHAPGPASSCMDGTTQTIARELKVIEDPSKCCEYKTKCDIQSVMGDLNARVIGFLSGIRLAEIVDNAHWTPSEEKKAL